MLKAPSYLLLEYLNHNDMALQLYGVSIGMEPYGILRLNMMGSLIAILQDEHQLSIVDALLVTLLTSCI